MQKVYDSIKSELEAYKQLGIINEHKIGKLRSVIEVEHEHCHKLEKKLSAEMKELKKLHKQDLKEMEEKHNAQIERLQQYQGMLK